MTCVPELAELPRACTSRGGKVCADCHCIRPPDHGIIRPGIWNSTIFPQGSGNAGTTAGSAHRTAGSDLDWRPTETSKALKRPSIAWPAICRDSSPFGSMPSARPASSPSFRRRRFTRAAAKHLKVARYVLCQSVQECGYATIYRAEDRQTREVVRLAVFPREATTRDWLLPQARKTDCVGKGLPRPRG